MRTKRKKKVKLESKVKIRRRLMRLWLARVREDWRNMCAVCCLKSGDVLPNGKKTILDCHHIESRNNGTLRYNPMNGILLCKSHHKFGRDSFHRSAVWAMDWLRNNHPETIEYIIALRNQIPPDLNNREVLARIEDSLKRRRKGRGLPLGKA